MVFAGPVAGGWRLMSWKRRVGVSLMRVVLVGLAICAWPGAASAERSRSFLGGVVETKDGQPLGAAQVIVEPRDGASPAVAYTNPQGLFRIDYVPGPAVLLRANAFGFQPRAIPVDLQKEGPTVRIRLSPVAPESAVKTVTVTSGPKSSGWGADWSSVYSTCGETEPGYRIRTHSFRLQGDRSCGAWAECMPLEQSDTRVCWGFRLQGRSEGAAFQQAVRASEGVLTLTLERASPAPRPHVTAYVLCSPSTRTTALELRSALTAGGWRVAELQSLDAPFTSRIVSGEEAGSEAAAEVERIIRAARDQLAKARGGPVVLSSVSRLGTEAPPGVVEIWLGQSGRMLKRR
jgi:hypothetical protein